MPGKIVATPVKAGDAVAKGQPVVVLEAMKMEHALTAPFDGGGGKRVRLGRGSGRGRLRTGAYQERGVIVVSGALAAMAMTASLMAEPGMQTVRVEPDDLADLQCIVTLMEGIGEDEAQNPSLMPALNYFMGKIAGRGRFERWDKVVVAYRRGSGPDRSRQGGRGP